LCRFDELQPYIYPQDTLVQRNWLPSIRAAVAMERKDPNRAIELLEDANAIELGQATSAIAIFLCPVYVRGEAYLPEFQVKNIHYISFVPSEALG
jgi:hypothetical protein